MSLTAYPLCWPAGWKRVEDRKFGHFNKKEIQRSSYSEHSYLRSRQLSISDGVQRVLSELTKLGIDREDIVVSTNVKTRLDGLPYSNMPEPTDPGVAVYWRKNNETKCMAVDRYTRVADNLAAIAATIEAMRAIERHGGAEILDRVFLGFQALPEPEAWWSILGFEYGNEVTIAQAETNFRELAKKHHPDHGGDPIQFSLLARAIKQARETLSQ